MTDYLLTIPTSIRGIFERAFLGNSKAAAIKAKCLDCCCFNKDEVRNCSVKKCPLWVYRPYQKDAAEDEK